MRGGPDKAEVLRKIMRRKGKFFSLGKEGELHC